MVQMSAKGSTEMDELRSLHNERKTETERQRGKGGGKRRESK